jgi:hypothetical protein
LRDNKCRFLSIATLTLVMQIGIAASETRLRALHAKQCRAATMREFSPPLKSNRESCGRIRGGACRRTPTVVSEDRLMTNHIASKATRVAMSAASVLLFSVAPILLAAPAQAQSFNQMLVFGDSTVDSGFFKALPNPGGGPPLQHGMGRRGRGRRGGADHLAWIDELAGACRLFRVDR